MGRRTAGDELMQKSNLSIISPGVLNELADVTVAGKSYMELGPRGTRPRRNVISAASSSSSILWSILMFFLIIRLVFLLCCQMLATQFPYF